MLSKVHIIFVITFWVEVCALYNSQNDQVSLEILEDGKNQYELLQERGELPQYGECWKAAIEHIQNSCNHLSENVQSDIALRITNCFLEMSGHETYNCDLDKKLNLRGICINSMTDRAFNVYTEFYTHAQNICWFLRGQIWQEKMSNIALRASQQLETSLEKHEILLEQQNDSLHMQQRLLQHGHSLETLLNESRTRTQAVIDDIRTSTLEHQRLLNGLVNGLAGLQSWLVGEISWFDSFIFYVGGIFVILAVTSAECTASSRLPVLFVLSVNVLLERAISNIVTGSLDISQTYLLHERLQSYVWWCRRFISLICLLIVCIKAHYYRNYMVINNSLLTKIHEQNRKIWCELETLRCLVSVSHNPANLSESSIEVTNEKLSNGFSTPNIYAFNSPESNEHIESNQTPVHTNNSYLHHNTQSTNLNDNSSKSPCRYNLRTRS